MDPCDIERLKTHHFVLVKDMDPELVVDYLFCAAILNDHHVKEIHEHHDSKKKNRQLLDILKISGPESFRKFCEALHATNQHDLANLLDEHNQPATACERSIQSAKDVQSSKEDLLQNLKILKYSLKEMNVTRFQKVYPLSLPFTFDIENSWVSLALEEENKDSQATEDHVELLKRAFDKEKMLIIEGDHATGKTSLMRRMAYEWAKKRKTTLIQQFANRVTGTLIGQRERKEMQSCYDLVLYAELCELHEKTFESIAELVLYYSKSLLKKDSYEKLEELLNNEQFCKERRILILLDGYDELPLDKQCSELNTYLFDSMIDKELSFNVVITTRNGYLSNLRGREGRFVFAKVIGFTTKQQKEKYINNHFLTKAEINCKEKNAAVRHLLENNENLNKLAETPLFLTFICLVHERTVESTLVKLYCNIIWWLIDRYQKNNPYQDIPILFGFKNGSTDKFETIQDHYLHFPQLHCLGKMALHNLQKDIFEYSDCEKFDLQPIIEQVGLLRKEKKYDSSFKLVSSYFFPHKSIQEFLAAFYCFCSKDTSNKWLLPDSKLDTSKMNEYEKFLLRIALSDKMSVYKEERKYYFERMADIKLDITFDAFRTTAGFNYELLNWFFAQCTNVQEIKLRGERNTEDGINAWNETSVHSESAITSKMSSPLLFSFSDLTKLHLVKFEKFAFEANIQLSITNCPSLNNVQFSECQISNTTLGIATLPAILTLILEECEFGLDSQLTIKNCPSLENLHFDRCKMKGRTILDIATLPAIDTVEFSFCKIDLAAWQSITDQIRNSSVKCLELTLGKYSALKKQYGYNFHKEFLVYLQKCTNVEEMEITIWNYKIRQQFSFSDLMKLHSLTFEGCTFEANSQLFFSNCPSLKNLKFNECEIESSTILGIATLPAIDTMKFNRCKINLATWQSITDEIRISPVKCLKLSADYFMKDCYSEFLDHLQKWERIEEIFITNVYEENDFILNLYEEEVTSNLVQTAQKLPRLKSITIGDAYGRRLNEVNKERIEKAGQERYPHFLIKYVE